MKKLFALVLALVMVMSLATAAFAAEGETGTLTITGAHTDYTYEIYRILDLESYADKNYSYKVNAKWADFFATDAAKKYFAVDEDGYISQVEGSTLSNAAETAQFAQDALAWAKANTIAPEKSTKNTGDFEVTTGNNIKFSDLELGYYLVDSDLGALCGLSTTNPDAVLTAKNTPPTQDKQVQEDSTIQWGGANTADIGQTVNFRVTVNVHAGAQKYVLHDSMSEGLTFVPSSVVVTHENPDANPPSSKVIAAEGNYEVVTDPAAHTDACKGNCTSHGNCTFEIKFSDDFMKTLEKNDKLIITYSAVVNENAVIGDAGNSNNSRLEFGEGYCTGWDETVTKVFSFDIVKTDDENKLIDGAKFEVYDVAEGGTALKFVKVEDGKYRRAVASDPAESVVTEIEVKGGKVTVEGFDNGTHYLYETVAPAGYNKLDERIAFTISDANLSATFENDVYSAGSGVQVENKSGTVLPQTGGMGTTLFYVFGTVLVAAAVVLLVTKKRMTAEN